METLARSYDVAIVGGGLAGLTLARHLLLDGDERILLLERRDELPPDRQKVGESTVQLAGYYLSRVLDLEEYLLRRHFMKYNLRFYWRSAGRDNSRFEDYGQGFIRNFSNVASYQLDRNEIERELLERNSAEERFRAVLGARRTRVELAEGGPHRVVFEHDGESHDVEARWVVDTTGRQRLLARQLESRRDNTIAHGSFFWWVDGTIDLDKLTDLPLDAIRKKPERRFQGHLPTWLATNHFCAEGLWFWVIPLQGKTSLGIVYDPRVLPHDEIFSVEKATRWVCEKFPLFAHDLPQREVLDFGGYRDFSYDCERTISPHRWAMTGESGRFSDPLYSPGSDLISIYNTLLVDAIRCGDDDEALASRTAGYEQLMRAAYAAYEPSYAVSYDALGDQEAFTLKYSWELAVYFGFYVFPFLNDLFTDRRFLPSYFKAFARLGPINASLHRLLSAYVQWKKEHVEPPAEPVFFDFSWLGPLAEAETTFYEVGVTVEEAREVLDRQVANLEEFARLITARIAAVAAGAPEAAGRAAFVERLDPPSADFDPESFRRTWEECRDDPRPQPWSFDLEPLSLFDPTPREVAAGETA